MGVVMGMKRRPKKESEPAETIEDVLKALTKNMITSMPTIPPITVHEMEIDDLANFWGDLPSEEPEDDKVQIKRKPSPLCDW